MEFQDHDEETYAACEEQAAYGAHHEYVSDENYDDPYYAMSASAAHNHHDDYPNEYVDEETHAS